MFLIRNTGTEAYLGITTGRIAPGLAIAHVIAFGTDAHEASCLEYLDELLMGDWSPLRHASAEAGETYALR